MNNLQFLQSRTSIPAKLLGEPKPTPEQLDEILKAAVAAPDHGHLRPWRFIVIEGDAREKLGDIFAKAALQRDPSLDATQVDRQREKPLRSPTILTVVCKIQENHAKVPVLEQILSAGTAAHQAMLASNALGFGAIWLTGPNAFDENVKAALNIEKKDQIIGFIYLGTATISKPNIQRPNTKELTEYWNP